MTKQSINVGTTPNDSRGDSLRAAFQKINANFTELYTVLGLNSDSIISLGAFEFTGSIISTTDSSSIVLDQAVRVTSELTVDGDIRANNIVFGTAKLTVTNDGEIYVNGLPAATSGGSPTWDSIAGKPVFATVATSGSYTDLSSKPTDIGQFTDTGNLLVPVTVSATAPMGAVQGQLWYDTISARMYIYYGTSWVDSSPSSGTPATPSLDFSDPQNSGYYFIIGSSD
jgi:hypothetical protein